jgi:hypothetical protein
MTTLDRRSFFRASAGAAVAAPVAMKQVTEDMLYAVKRGPLVSISGLAGQLGSPNQSHLHDELASLTKMLANIENPRNEDRNLEVVAAQRIDGLRSVSASNKARMMLEERERRELLRQRSWMQRRIDEIKEHLGPLGEML